MRHDLPDDEHVIVIEKHSAGIGPFLLGLGLGTAVALLLAPQSGETTRRQITRRAQDAGDGARRRAQGIVGDVSSEVNGRIGRARTAVADRVDRARDAVEMKRQRMQRAAEARRVAAFQARDDLERRIAETKAAYQAGTGVAPGGYELLDDDGLEG